MNSQWYEAKTGNHQGLIIEEGTGRNVAVTYDKSDSAIIAAAPDLLAALESLMDDADVCEVAGDDAIRQARAAIAKAKGE